MTENDLYWLFSTIAQTFGALVALIGMITVYRFQTIESILKGIMDKSFEDRKKAFSDKSYTQTTKTFIDDMNEKFSFAFKAINDQSDLLKNLVRCATIIKNLIDLHKRLKFRFLLFLIPHLIFIFISIYFLLYCRWLLCWPLWTKYIIAICLLVSFTLTLSLCYSLIESRVKGLSLEG